MQPTLLIKWLLELDKASQSQISWPKSSPTSWSSSLSSFLQVRDFVNRYMPAYKAYLPVMYDKGPSTGKGDNVIIFEIDESRGLLQRKIPDV